VDQSSGWRKLYQRAWVADVLLLARLNTDPTLGTAPESGNPMRAAERYASEWIDLPKEIVQCLRIANQAQRKQVNRFQQDRMTPAARPMRPPMDSTLLP
jgi:hypothetical protein